MQDFLVLKLIWPNYYLKECLAIRSPTYNYKVSNKLCLLVQSITTNEILITGNQVATMY